MRKLGIIGGASWHSTATYYNLLNLAVAQRLGGLHSAPLILESLDFATYATLQQAGLPDEATGLVVAAAERLKTAGVDGLLLASNSMHRASGAVMAATGLPLLDIRDLTADRITTDGRTRVALLGTRPTMTEPFAREPYEQRGIVIQEVGSAWIDEIDRIIFDELAKGQVVRESQRKLKTLITDLGKLKVQAIVLGCTELAMAVDVRANVLPVYDTTAIHARAAVEWMLDDGEGAKVRAAA